MSNENVYLQLDFGSGNLYQYSKDGGEGFEKHTSSTGKESFRKYHKYGTEGTLSSVSVRDSAFGKQLSIGFEEGIFINFGLNDQKGNIDQYAEAVIKILPKVNKSDKLSVSPYKFRPEGEKYDKTGISFKVNNEKIKGLTNTYDDKNGKEVAGDIPKVIWKIDKLDKTKKKPDLASVEKKNDYLTDVLMEQTERLKWVNNGQQTAQPQASGSAQEEIDELPF